MKIKSTSSENEVFLYTNCSTCRTGKHGPSQDKRRDSASAALLSQSVESISVSLPAEVSLRPTTLASIKNEENNGLVS